MTWTITNLVVEIITGVLGAHAVAAATRTYNFGALGHSVVGAIGGGISGLFSLPTMMFAKSDIFPEPSPSELTMAHGLVGAIAGGILMLSIGFLKHVIEEYLRVKTARAEAAPATNLSARSQKSKKFIDAIDWSQSRAA
jgi:uncharacterized membrane protein YeaQ/YmgE (transglycosylase-associated protein family)